MRTGLASGLVATLVLVLAASANRAPDEAANAVGRAIGSREPQRPERTVDTSPVRSVGRTQRVPKGGDLQAAIDQAKPGDVIALEPGATYQGPFQLRRKDGESWILITTELGPEFPAAGARVQPSHASQMAKLVASRGSVITADAGAHHYRLVGLEIAPATGTFLLGLITLGEGDQDQLAAVPHHLIIDRCYVRGDPRRGSRRGVALNARDAAVIDSHFSDFKEEGRDSQAIGGWSGPGPFKIANNYLEAAGENVMFGGGDPAIRGLVPSDIEITGNHLAKPLSWKRDDPLYDGSKWAVKNLFELKNARRVVIDGNLFEHNWPQAQNGFAILFTVRNQDGGAPWSVVEDVTFTNNILRRVAAGINILGHDDNHQSRQTSRIAIRNNVFTEIGGAWGHGRLLQLLEGTRDITIDHNTAFQTGSALFADGRPHTGFVFQNNLMHAPNGGIIGSGTGGGTASLERYFPGAIVRRNVLVGADEKLYPRDNFFPANLTEAGVVRGQPPRLVVALNARFRGAATDGRDPGADVLALAPALQTAGWQVPPVEPAPFLFWLSVGLLGYLFAGYPILARVKAALRSRPTRRLPIEPTVTVVVAAHNEGDRIAARIANLLALDYPADRLEVLIGSDGSTDDTARRACDLADPRVQVMAFDTRRGKPAVINDLVRAAGGDIIVFADARQTFDAGAVRALAANFGDPQVGGVSGELVIAANRHCVAVGRGAAFYWRYEKLIKATESRGGSLVGATGAIYAIRRSLFEPLPEDTILDDVWIPMRIVRRGYRVVFEPRAKAHDNAPQDDRNELGRRVRTIGGNFQLLARERWLMNPLQNPLWLETMSHKALRLLLPLLLMVALVTNAILLDRPLFQWLMAAQVAFYGAALAGFVYRRSEHRPLVLSVPYTMCLMSWATVLGFSRFLTARQCVTWERSLPSTTRPRPSTTRPRSPYR
jgi:cellulose synthase/poly-beta-1,6-N-acetylglucosamine synthase-like glycosyltransferase